MAKKKSSRVVEAEPVVDEDDDNDQDKGEEDDDEVELLQVDLGDMVKLKQVLDEAVASVVLENLDEDYRWDNFKLAIMALACAFAMVAQFAPVPFPDSRPLLGVCGCTYFLLSGILQLIATFIDKDAILLTVPLSKSEDAKKKKKTTTMMKKNAVKNEMLQKYGVRVRSSLPRFSEWYTITLEFNVDGDKDQTKATPYVEKTWSVGQFFDEEGFFDESGLMKEIEDLYARLERADYNTPDKEKKNQ